MRKILKDVQLDGQTYRAGDEAKLERVLDTERRASLAAQGSISGFSKPKPKK